MTECPRHDVEPDGNLPSEFRYNIGPVEEE
jgi:hypothetical protein